MIEIDHVKEEFFFAELLLPLRHAVARRNIHYLQLKRGADSYWSPIASRTGGLERLSATECGGATLLHRLGLYWAARGDTFLPRLIPYLVALRAEIRETKPQSLTSEPKLSDFAYPLF